MLLATCHQGIDAAAPPAMEWQRCLGGSLLDNPGEMIRSKDGNILLVANTTSHNGDITSFHGSTDIWLTKLDSTGNIIWEKSFGGSSTDIATGLLELSNGNLILTGYSSSANGDFPSNRGNFDAFIICTDNHGNIQWSRVFGGSLPDLIYSCIQSSDGGFILGGGSYSSNGNLTQNNGEQDIWLLKTDCNGNLLWQISVGGNRLDVCYSLEQDDNGNIYACGTSNSSSGNVIATHGNYDLCVSKFDVNGNPLWSNTYGGSEYETAQTILIDSQKKIFIGGYSLSSNGDLTGNFGMGDSWLIRINSNGNLLDQMNMGGSGNDYLFSILETTDGGYLFASGSGSGDFQVNNPLGAEDIWLMKADSAMNFEWSKNFGGTGNERPLCVIPNSQDGFLIAGYTFSNNNDVSGGHGSSDIWLLNLACLQPLAFFTTPPTICINSTLPLIDQSHAGSTYNWLLNNTSISTLRNSTVSLINTGYQHLTLNVQTCTFSSSYNVDVYVYNCNLPQIAITSSDKSICAGDEIMFSDASTNASSWLWTFPGGNPSSSILQNPTVQYNQAGTYSVYLTATNAYGDQSVTKYNYITVNQLPMKPEITIQGNLLLSSPAVHYQWFVSSQPILSAQSQNYHAATGGYYSVQIEDINGCSSESDSIYYTMTSTIDQSLKETVSVFYNISTKEIDLIFSQPLNGKIELFSSSGQLLKEIIFTKSKQSLSVGIDEVPVGIYHVFLQTGNAGSFSKSIIKL